MPNFTRIPTLAQLRRLPRLGKIRLGVKVQTASGKTYPKETPYFIVPPEVAAVYGERPTALDVLFPINDLDIVMPVAYKWYGSAKQKRCVGNGRQAYRFDEHTKQWQLRSCPCDKLEQRECSRRAHLQVTLPRVNPGGVYQIDTGNLTAIVNIESTLTFLNHFIGRFAMIPMTLERVSQTGRHANGDSSTHYPLTLRAMIDPQSLDTLKQETPAILAQAKQWRLAEPEDLNPTYDPGATIVPESSLDSAESQPSTTSDPESDQDPTLSDLQEEILEEEPRVEEESIEPENRDSIPLESRRSEPARSTTVNQPEQAITQRQRSYIMKLVNGRMPHDTLHAKIQTLTRRDASALIDALQAGDFSPLSTLISPDNTSPSPPQ